MAVRGWNPINNSYEELFLRLLLSLLLIFDGGAVMTSSPGERTLKNNVTVTTTSPAESLLLEKEDLAEHNTSARSISHSRCDATFFDRDFYYASPGYPKFYEHNLECVITIKRGQDACRLQLVFQSFDVEDSPGCRFDYVEIDGQRICGTLPDNQERVFSFTDSEMRIRFHTNAYEARRGFSVRGRQLLCGQEITDSIRGYGGVGQASTKSLSGGQCGRTYDDVEFEITSPDHPSTYGHGLDCLYTAKKCRTDICSLQITFVTVDLEGSHDCSNDFLEFGQRRFCNVPKPNIQTFDFPGQTFDIRFRSDASASRSGFRIRVEQRPCNHSPLPSHPSFPDRPPPFPVGPGRQSCNLVMLPEENRSQRPLVERPMPSFVLRSPGFPQLPYPPDQRCVFVMPKASITVCALEVIVQEFDMASGPGCDEDYFSVDGQRMCGVLAPGLLRTFQFTDREIVLRFVSNAHRSGRGFSLVLRQRDCLAPPLLPNPNPFFPGSTTPRPFPVFPPKPIPTSPPPPFPTSSPQPFPIPTRKPFPPVNCDEGFDSRVFVVTSPSFTPDNTLCTYRVRKYRHEPICFLQVEFAVFDFGPAKLLCTNGYLEINGQRICGPNTEGAIRTFLFPDDVMTILYWSGTGGQSKFRLNALQRPCSQPDFPPTPSPSPPWPHQGCGGFVVAGNGDVDSVSGYGKTTTGTSARAFELRSDGYPLAPYPADLDCSYVIVKASPRVCQLEIRVVDFQLEPSEQCEQDFLEINGVRLCGFYPSGTVKVFDFREREMVLRFRSNDVISGRGFLLHGRQSDCWPGPMPGPPYLPTVAPYDGCNRTYQTSDVSLHSEFEPHPLGGGGFRCQYIICKSRIDVCFLEVEFKYFCLSEQAQRRCDGDYLEIGGRRHCGKIPAGSVRRFNFPSDKLVLEFNSIRGPVDGLGFAIQVRQIPCSDARPVTQEPPRPYFPTTHLPPPPPRPRPPLPVEDCDVVYAQYEFQWVSPNFPGDYYDNLDCSLTIKKNNPSICGLRVRFRSFDIENSVGCVKDSLELFGQKMCGYLQDNTEHGFSFYEDVTIFHFHSDDFGNRRGFYLMIEQQQCLDGPVFRNSGALRDMAETSGSAASTEENSNSSSTLAFDEDAENVTMSSDQIPNDTTTSAPIKINP